jgi:dienelactone hydrolase
VVYDLQGILLRPPGAGPFPAVIISHGAGNNANGYSRAVAQVMVGWGLVCIATNYTHAGGVSIGSPGSTNELGASLANVRRAHALLDILGALGYVDVRRVALHGHSMGAYVTTATASATPTLSALCRIPRAVYGPASLGVRHPRIPRRAASGHPIKCTTAIGIRSS